LAAEGAILARDGGGFRLDDSVFRSNNPPVTTIPWFRRPLPIPLVIAASLLPALLPLGCSHRDSRVVGSGTIELTEVDVASLVGGRVVRLLVDEGDTVRAGDTLVVLAHGEVAGEVTAMEGQTARADALYREQAKGPRPAEVKAARKE
jgi:multidrug efflux pump subunit AcrA (membrane-fusion protein)